MMIIEGGNGKKKQALNSNQEIDYGFKLALCVAK